MPNWVENEMVITADKDVLNNLFNKIETVEVYSDIVDVPRIFGIVGHQNTSVADELIFSQ